MSDSLNSLQNPKIEREKAMAAERRKILDMAPEKALEAILEHPFPVTLVQSMSEEDLYYLVHQIGPDDALPVLGVASNAQWEYLMDMESWNRDQMDSQAMTRWFQRLIKADNDRFTYWITNEKRDDFAFYLFHNIELRIREYDQDPGEIGDDFFTEDQTYYVRMRPYPAEQKPQEEERDLFLTDLLRRVSILDYALYRRILLESSALIPAEVEEELFRLRNVRLAEKGFLPPHEAVGVYQPLKVADLPGRRKPPTFSGRAVDTYPLPIGPSQSDRQSSLFGRTLAQIHDEPTLHRLQAEFAGLCNQVIAADQLRIRDREPLARMVHKVDGYISIGLEKILSESDEERPYEGPGLIQSYFLADIFRVGYGCALALKWKADRWRRLAWFTGQGLPLGFWGEAGMGVLGGLLLKKPLFYNPRESGPIYREFASMDDITRCETELDAIIAYDDLLSLMEIQISPGRTDNFLTYQNLLLTLWAYHCLDLSANHTPPPPLSMTQFRRFFEALWQSGDRPRRVSDATRERFLGWLAQSSGLATYEIAERMTSELERLFGDIEQELGNVSATDLDPRYIQMFLLKP